MHRYALNQLICLLCCYSTEDRTVRTGGPVDDVQGQEFQKRPGSMWSSKVNFGPSEGGWRIVRRRNSRDVFLCRSSVVEIMTHRLSDHR
jgi:hypothetical protein